VFILKIIFKHVFLPVFIGGLIYLAFRSKSLVMFDWFDLTGFSDTISFIRGYTIPIKNKVPDWIYLSIPNCMWVYSFTSALMLVWKKELTLLKIWLCMPITFGIFAEILQSLGLFPGTFDFIDLILGVFGFFLSYVTIISLNKKFQQNENNFSKNDLFNFDF